MGVHDPDAAAVDELCRLALVARRLGCRVRLLDVDPELHELLRLAGVDHLLTGVEPSTTPPDRRHLR